MMNVYDKLIRVGVTLKTSRQTLTASTLEVPMAIGKRKPFHKIPKHRIEQFWQQVSIRGIDDCWPYQGNSNGRGYGAIMINGINYVAHRLAWFSATGQNPYPLGVLHKCIASRSCCNPTHLYLGTDIENARDREEQGRERHAFGEQNCNAKLTDEKVKEIRLLYANGGITAKALGKRFGVDKSAVLSLLHRRTWKRVL